MIRGRGDPSPDGFYSVAEAADLTGLHPGSILRGVREGRYPLKPHEMPVWRARRKFFFPIDQVERLAATLRTLRS